MKKIIKKLLPKSFLQLYHKFLAIFAAIIYGNPSDKLIIIGVTGTNGKSTTSSFIVQLLEGGGFTVGAASTIKFKIGDTEIPNTTKMTMVGRFKLQKLLAQMVEKGCTHVVIETTSQGIEQFRHLGINYDYAVFTNLTPEHIEAHGGFENYKKAKGKLFSHLMNSKRKIINGKVIKKTSVINIDDKHARFFLSFNPDQLVGYSLKGNHEMYSLDILNEAKIVSAGAKTQFDVKGKRFELPIPGAFNVYNMLAALSIAMLEGINLSKCQEIIKHMSSIEGRAEFINVGQDFNVIVDYAHEPAALNNIFDAAKNVTQGNIIHVFGACGGGRDQGKQPILGEISADHAFFSILTNEDPYDDDPMEIIENIRRGFVKNDMTEGKDYIVERDRRKAIQHAFKRAKKGDTVLITGKGSEQAMMVKGEMIEWNEREIVLELLQEYLKTKSN